ncbi:hypothetical protein [Thermus thermamylovorans]|uniref:hypothetical protein n=1 Tax=Thermus thermamylovorans TaxID=2509362 RepID=UPI0011AE23AC|nr:hypothetical protein [Thermus thermamylovorans]
MAGVPTEVHGDGRFVLRGHLPVSLRAYGEACLKERAAALESLAGCDLCPRECRVDRGQGVGVCRVGR